MKNIKFILLAIFAVFFISSVSATVLVSGGFNGNLQSKSISVSPGTSVNLIAVFTSTNPPIITKSVQIPSNFLVSYKSCESVSQNSYYCSYTISTAAIGSYQILMTGKDSSGSIDSDVLTFKVTSINPNPIPNDTTAPVITVLGNNPQTVEVFSNYLDAGATAYDNVDGNLTSQIITLNNVNTSVLGNYTVAYIVSDSSGNSATATRTVNVVDTIAPVITFTGVYQNLIFNSDNISLNGHVSDNYQLANVSIILDGSVYQTSYSGVNNTNYSFSLTSLSDGNHTWAYQACDTSGNCETTSPVSFTIDTTAPSIAFASPTNNSVINGTEIPVNLTTSDSGSGLQNATVYIYDSSGLVNSVQVTYSPFAFNFTGLSDGTYYLNATAYDNAGNSNSTATLTINLNNSNYNQNNQTNGSSGNYSAANYQYSDVYENQYEEQLNHTNKGISLSEPTQGQAKSTIGSWIWFVIMLVLLALIAIVSIVLIRGANFKKEDKKRKE